MPSLHQSLAHSLQAVPTQDQQQRMFELTTLCTKPFRTHTLFSHALDPTLPIMRVDYLITLAERFADYRGEPHPGAMLTVPVFALEASLYTIQPTAVQILYVSKIDTTGLSPWPAPAGLLTGAFLAHFIHHIPKSISSLRIHIFARAAREGQYLFPASAENAPNGPGDGAKLAAAQASTTTAGRPRAGKRLLNDQQLVKWWHQTLSRLVVDCRASQPKKTELECFYLVPGFDEHESVQVLPVSKQVKEIWNYGHPYTTISTPLSLANPSTAPDTKKPVHLLSDLIPAFNDDPKARFLHCIGDCSTSPSGEPGDYDDAMVERSATSLEKDRHRERAKINQISPDEFWQRMGARQECSDGRLAAFFVIGVSNLAGSLKTDADGSTILDKAPKPLVGVFKNVWISLWSKIHNKDYAKLETASVGYDGWIKDVKASIDSTILEDQLKNKHKRCDPSNEEEDCIQHTTDKADQSLLSFDNCHSIVVVDNPVMKNNQKGDDSKRFHDDHQEKSAPVHVLQPRKKAKK